MELLEAVQKARMGDQDAFAWIFDMYAPKIKRFIGYKISDPEQRADILQEVFIKAWRGLPNLPLENLNFQAWLYRIAANSVNDYYRKAYRQPEALELTEDIAGSSDQFKFDDKATIQKAFAKLPPQYKEVLTLRYIEELELEEIAAVLNKTNLSVRVLVHRSLKKLREILQDYDIQR